jgi:phosphohistidine phosphatase
MVNIVIMRHGEAEPMKNPDSQRQLTARGKQETLLMANWLERSYRRFNWVLTSPYQRTLQTAELLFSKQGPLCQLETLSYLVPEGNANHIRDVVDIKLSEQPAVKILLVSHMPLVSFLVEAFTQPGLTPVFNTAGVCCIDYRPEQGGRLLEKVSPHELALLSH